MNKWIGYGRLTRKPELKAMSNGKSMVRFNMAVDRKYKRDGEASVDFISCVAFDKTADFIDKYFDKGSKIIVEGRIQTGSYEKDGVKHSTTDIMVESVEFGDSKNVAGTPAVETSADGFSQISDDDVDALPFT